MFIIEGNIGAGKSTFLQLLAKHMSDIHAVLEPLHNWQRQVYGQSLLTNFYQDPKRWAYTLETLTMICRVKEHIALQKITVNTNIVERSLYSGYYCFAQNSFAQGFLTDLEWQLYKEWYQLLVTGTCLPPQGFIYLKVDPEIAFERIQKRNRHAEKTITLAYLRQIHARHEKILIANRGISSELQNVPVLILDCNEEFEMDELQLKKHIDIVKNFIAQTQNASTSIPQTPYKKYGMVNY